MDENEYEQEWLSMQPKLQIHHFDVYSPYSIPYILKKHTNIQDFRFSYYFNLNNPGFNNRTNNSLGQWYLKQPPSGLITVYFKPRENPFNHQYQIGDYQYTLDDLLKDETTISEVYIFWNVNRQRPININ